ncbi:MAG: glycosyltransferase family 4 protein [Elusimicrobiota bacterium]
MKVLIVNRYMSVYGGAESVVRELALGLLKRGIGTKVVTLNVSEEVRGLCPGVEFVLPPKVFPYAFRSTGITAAMGILDEYWWLRKLIKSCYREFDIINTHNFPASIAVHGLDKPVVWLCNEPPDLVNNLRPSLIMKLFRWVGLKVDREIINSSVDTLIVADENNFSRVEERYGRRDSVVIPYGISTEIFYAQKVDAKELREKYKIPFEKRIVLQAGVLSPQKNQLASVNALNNICKNGVDAVLVLVGNKDTKYYNEVVDAVKSYGMESRVVYTGIVGKTELAKLYNIADVCVFPVKEQGGWLAPFEAISCAKPVVVSTTMGAAGLIKSKNLGVVTNDFGNALQQVFDNHSTWQKIAGEGMKWVHENLTWDKYVDEMINKFEQTLNR